MTASNHALAGALTAILIPKPIIAIPLAFVLHFGLDAIPHFGLDEKGAKMRDKKQIFWIILGIDMLIAAALLINLPLLITFVPAWLVFACMFACMAPDLLWGWRLALEIKYKKITQKSLFSRFHTWIQWREFPSGLIVELIVFIGLLSLIFLRYI